MYFLYNCLKDLHETLNKEQITIEEYCLYVESKVTSKDKDVIMVLLDEIKSCSIDDKLLSDILIDLKNKQLAYDLALVGVEVNEGRSSIDKIFETIDKFEKKQEEENYEFVTSNLEELYNGTVKKQGLRWRLNTLNRMLGSLRLGDFGFIFARPETGKTTFLASEVTYFAEQVNQPILWFNNEEQGSKVMLRCYQASLGIPLAELYSDLTGNQQRFYELGGDKIRMFDSANIHRNHVEALCRDLNPALVLVDQVDKIKGFSNDREDLRLGAIYIWLREIAKQYCPVIGVCQADATGEGKRWLTMENVANAKTAKQAEADWILGIGKTHDASLEFVRHFHLSKNKLAGDEDTDPELRHGRCDVLIEPNVARYKDLEF